MQAMLSQCIYAAVSSSSYRVGIIWFLKRQNTVEAATFGSKLVALQICKEMTVALRYKLHMFGVPIDGLAYAFCNN
jgi:hypothetical protein